MASFVYHNSASPCSPLFDASKSSSVGSSPRSVSFTHALAVEGFAFANIRGNIHLVQVHSSDHVTSNDSPLLDVKIFRHEFITIFRLSHTELLHLDTDIRILEFIDDDCTLYEEENGTVFLAKELTERLHQMTSKRTSRGMCYGDSRGQRANVYR